MVLLDDSFCTSMDKAINKSLTTLIESKSESEFLRLEKKLRTYLNVYDGSLKSFLDIHQPFDDLFHEHCVHIIDDHDHDDGSGTDNSNTSTTNVSIKKQNHKIIIQKEGMKEAAKAYLSSGIKADLIKLKQIDDNHFEEWVRFSCPRVDVICHATGTIFDGKIVKIVPCQDSIGAYKALYRLVESQKSNILF